MVVHDFRAPLSSIKLALALLASQPLGKEQSAVELLNAATESVEFLVQLTDDLLALGFSNHVLVTDPTWFSIQELMRRSVEQARLSAIEKEISIELMFEDALPEAWGSPVGLGRVFQNLIFNSVKFTPKGGKVLVSVKKRLEPGEILVEVTDTGPGIPIGLRKEVFESFKNRNSIETGLGLGLAIVKRIVNGHGGTVELLCPPNGGTSFQVLLPCHSKTIEPSTE
jgi:two-component system, OmpR family, phosphate regulon sensor histidine kinase PhoR